MEVFYLTALACGFVIGFCICFTGVGGGAVIIPVIVLVFNEPPSVAVGSAGLYAAATKIMAAAQNARQGNIDYRLFFRIVAFAAPGAIAAAVAVNWFLAAMPQHADAAQEFLRFAVIAAIVFSLFAAQFARSQSGRGLPAAAFGVGGVMGLTGVGGGVLLAPLMLALTNTPPKRVVGTSIAVALALSALAALAYAGGGQINLPLALWMSAGSLLALPLGGWALARASQTTVRRAMLTLIAAAALLLAADGFVR